MNSTVMPQGIIPGPNAPSSPKPSPSPSTQQTPTTEQTPVPPEETAVSDTRDDAAIRAQIERTLAADPALAKLAVSTLVDEGRVTIVGAVTSAELKARIEKAISSIKGVASVDNQLVVTEATP
jgi:osmotically-inducible protein OsmY